MCKAQAHLFAVCFGVFKLHGLKKKVEETLEEVGFISRNTNYIGQKVCYIESSTSDGLPVSLCSFSLKG